MPKPAYTFSDIHPSLNGKIAKALGLTVPPSLLVQASRVIE